MDGVQLAELKHDLVQFLWKISRDSDGLDESGHEKSSTMRFRCLGEFYTRLVPSVFRRNSTLYTFVHIFSSLADFPEKNMTRNSIKNDSIKKKNVFCNKSCRFLFSINWKIVYPAATAWWAMTMQVNVFFHGLDLPLFNCADKYATVGGSDFPSSACFQAFTRYRAVCKNKTVFSPS